MIRAFALVTVALLATPAAGGADLCVYTQSGRPAVVCVPVGGGS